MAAIIFDFDGTIADSFDYVTDFLSKERGLGKLTEVQKNELRHLSMASMARQLGFSRWQLPKLLIDGRKRMQHSIQHTKPFAEIPELLEKLQAEGHELFIISANSLVNVHNFLHKYDLHKHFLEVYGGIGFFSKTPAIRKLLKDQSIGRNECIYIGDEVRDIQAAQAAKIRVVAVMWGFARPEAIEAKKPTFIADQPTELLSILENI